MGDVNYVYTLDGGSHYISPTRFLSRRKTKTTKRRMTKLKINYPKPGSTHGQPRNHPFTEVAAWALAGCNVWFSAPKLERTPPY